MHSPRNLAETFVQSNVDRTYAILNDGALSPPEREQQSDPEEEMSAIVFPQVTRSAANFKSVVCLLAFVMIGALAASNAHAANSAETFVQSNIDRTYAVLNDGALSPPEREQRFRTLLLSVVDVRRVALFTLGPMRETQRKPMSRHSNTCSRSSSPESISADWTIMPLRK